MWPFVVNTLASENVSPEYLDTWRCGGCGASQDWVGDCEAGPAAGSVPSHMMRRLQRPHTDTHGSEVESRRAGCAACSLHPHLCPRLVQRPPQRRQCGLGRLAVPSHGGQVRRGLRDLGTWLLRRQLRFAPLQLLVAPQVGDIEAGADVGLCGGGGQ